jgi:hypothetical protein
MAMAIKSAIDREKLMSSLSHSRWRSVISKAQYAGEFAIDENRRFHARSDVVRREIRVTQLFGHRIFIDVRRNNLRAVCKAAKYSGYCSLSMKKFSQSG